MMKAIAAASILLFALTACGAGNGSAGVPKPNAPANQGAPALGAVTLTITLPRSNAQAGARRPAYVSAATQSVSVTPQGGAAQTFALTPSSPNCTSASGSLVCTLSVSVPIGQNQTIAISTYANTASTGHRSRPQPS